jgi:hypothetical protein
MLHFISVKSSKKHPCTLFLKVQGGYSAYPFEIEIEGTSVGPIRGVITDEDQRLLEQAVYESKSLTAPYYGMNTQPLDLILKEIKERYMKLLRPHE